MNKRINQTLSRTILTSGLTFLTVVSLYLFGGEVINGFAFALVVGIIIGTYSSIAIASPLLVIWNDYKGKKRSWPKWLAISVEGLGSGFANLQRRKFLFKL